MKTICFNNVCQQKTKKTKTKYVSISRSIHKEKWLILLNLKELNNKFKWNHPYHQIGFSIFCILILNWCVYWSVHLEYETRYVLITKIQSFKLTQSSEMKYIKSLFHYLSLVQKILNIYNIDVVIVPKLEF